jgi:hypothetical protein
MRCRTTIVGVTDEGSCGGALTCIYSAWFFPLSIAWSLQDKDFRVVNKAVGDRCGDSSVIKYFSPLGKGPIGRYDGGPFLVPCTDNLEEQI